MSVSNYARRMAHLSARIFGEQARPVPVKSNKVVRLMERQPFNKDPEIVGWYPRHDIIYYLMKTLRTHGIYRDEHQDFKDEMKRLRKLRGKGAPEKGKGKRALKRAS